MSINSALRKIDIPLVGIFAILVLSVSSIAAMWSTSPAAAKQPGPPYSTPMSVRDDGCYSTLGSVSNITSILGGASFGLVNAIVNVPVYDWDQTPDLAFTAQDTALGFGSEGLRGQMGGRVVGYAQDFDFKVTPIPNLMWMGRYFATQLPYDIAQIQSIASGTPNAYQLANPTYGTAGNPYIANPFIYQQGAIIYPNGIPRFQIITGPLTDPGGANNWLQSLNPALMLTNLQQMFGASNTILSQNSGIIDQVKTGNLNQIVGNLNASATNVIGAAARTLVDMPPLSAATVQYNVNGDAANDNCYEALTGSKKVPTYAFSVLDTAIPVTIPGWLYTPITLLDGKGFSSSGMTLYPPGSVNGKDLLDCYGRGTQPIVTGSGKWKLRDFTIGYGGGTGAALPFGWIGGFASYAINVAIANAIVAAGLAADAAAPGSGSSVATVALSLPSIETAFETYTSGMVFAFTLPTTKNMLTGKITKRAINRLPSKLSNRVVDYDKSKEFSVNVRHLIGSDGTNHALSQNGKQFNPDLYAVLKKPYELTPVFEIDNTSDARRDKLDGTTVKVHIDNKKTGFETGQTTIHDNNNVYRQSSRDKGGPTYDDNEGGSNRAFTKASVYRIVMKPGVIPNAIDIDKIASGTKTAYTGATLGASTDSCAFLRQKLAVGDTDTGSSTRANVSRLTNGNANNGRPEFTADSVQCDYAKRADGSQVRDVEVRMGSNDALQSLYDIDEKIPAETEPGTKYCYAVYYDSYGNDIKSNGEEWWGQVYNPLTQRGAINYNPNYSAETDKRYLSKAKCIISGYKPSMQVRGGDLMVNGGVYTGTNTKEFLASGATPKEQRTYGSWVEYGVISSGPVVNLGSGGIYRTGLTPSLEELGFLTFANNRNSSNRHDYGNYAEQVDDGFARVTRQFTSMSGQASTQVETATAVNLSDLQSGVYRLRPNATVDITTNGELPANRSIILLAQQGTIVNIASDIRIPLQYSSIGDISQVVLAPISDATGYAINVNYNVSQVDSWLINPKGSINTCRTTEPTASVENIPRSTGRCDNTLTVNGPVSADLLLLRRNGGKDQGDETTIAQSIPGESFNLRPDAYLWAGNYVDSAGKKYVTTNAVDLPPRY